MYTTLENIKSKINLSTLIQLLDDNGRTEDQIDFSDSTDPFIINFISVEAEAEVEINTYLTGRYTLPFTSVPGIIINLTDDFLIYNAYKRRRREDIPLSICNLKKEGIAQLEKIAAGKMDIGITGKSRSLSDEIRANKTEKDRLFNRKMWEKY